MKNKKILLFLLVSLVVLMAGASILYKKLAEENQVGGLVVETEVSEVETSLSEEETSIPEAESETLVDETESEAVEPQQVPDFTVYDADGTEVKLSEQFGKPLIVNFWASWCGPCTSELPHFQEAYEQYGDEITFMMVNMTDGMQETVDGAKSFVEEQGFTFPVYYDTAQSAAITYGVSSIPATYFVMADGMGGAYALGYLSSENLEQGIAIILEQ